MKILAIGDVVGRGGREALLRELPELRARHQPDFIIVNAENAAGGFGLTPALAEEFLAAETGIDVLTLGNHAWDQRAMLQYITSQPRVLRALNFPTGAPGLGAKLYQTRSGRRVLVAQLMGRLFMDPMDDPFHCLQQLLEQYPLAQAADAVVIDVHAEATSEKMALGHVADGRASFLFGTHTHVPTADSQILPGGTAYQSDLGMTGGYDSVIGMKKEISIARFMQKLPTERMTPVAQQVTVCGALVTTDDATGLAVAIQPVRVGGRLLPAG